MIDKILKAIPHLPEEDLKKIKKIIEDRVAKNKKHNLDKRYVGVVRGLSIEPVDPKVDYEKLAEPVYFIKNKDEAYRALTLIAQRFVVVAYENLKITKENILGKTLFGFNGYESKIHILIPSEYSVYVLDDGELEVECIPEGLNRSLFFQEHELSFNPVDFIEDVVNLYFKEDM